MPKTEPAYEIDISNLKPDSRNANKGTERGNSLLQKSLEQYGAGRAILLGKNDRIIAGNKTSENAGSIGLEKVIVVPTDGKTLVAVKRTDLDLDSDDKAREMAYADNRVSELDLDWDPEKLKEDLDAGLNLSGMFNEVELNTILSSEYEPPDSSKDFPELNPDDMGTDHSCPKCGYEW